MAGTALVRRPAEDAALRSPERPPLSAERITDLLIIARATSDRYGEVLFDHMLDRAMGGSCGEA